jgi:hypothetical protein
MTKQFRLGDDIDKGNIMTIMPLHDDAIMYANENHVQKTFEKMDRQALSVVTNTLYPWIQVMVD